MALTDIRTEVRRYTDVVTNFSTGDIDAAANAWYLTCWRRLDKVASHRTRTTQNLSLIADQLTAYTLTTAPLAIIDIFPPHANRNERTFIVSVDDADFRRHVDQTRILYVQESETSLLIRPAIDTAMTATVHYIRKPPVITTSQAQLHFADQTIAAGAIGRLFHSLQLADALYWIDERNPAKSVGAAYTLLFDEINGFKRFGDNSNLTMAVPDFPWK